MNCANWLPELGRFKLGSYIVKSFSSSSSSGSGAYAPEALQPIRLIVQTWTPPPGLDVPTYATRCLHIHMTREILAAKGGTVGENVGRQFCLNVGLQGPFWDLLHAANLQHGTNSFTSPPKEGALRTFSPWKILMASAGFEPASLGT